MRDTAAWTVGRVCNLMPETITPDILPGLMTVLAEALADQPKIAANACWAIHNLAEMVETDADAKTSRSEEHTSELHHT